jgi:hypothetical protein
MPMYDAKQTQTILLYGNSILIERLASKLQKAGGREVKQIDGGEPGDVSGIDFIVVDLCDAKTSQALPMLRILPGVVLLGIDAIANTITLMNQAHPAYMIQAVLDALQEAM